MTKGAKCELNHHEAEFRGERVWLSATGSLFFPNRRLIVVSDLHFGKSERQARSGGALLPPYDTLETLNRLEVEITQSAADTVICLGDSFDDDTVADNLAPSVIERLICLAQNRTWIWITGNHDSQLVGVPGIIKHEISICPFVFRHIAAFGAEGEISGHFHPKIRIPVRGRRLSRPCFLMDTKRIILPAFGTYAGGLDCQHQSLRHLMARTGVAITTGRQAIVIPIEAAHRVS